MGGLASARDIPEGSRGQAGTGCGITLGLECGGTSGSGWLGPNSGPRLVSSALSCHLYSLLGSAPIPTMPPYSLPLKHKDMTKNEVFMYLLGKRNRGEVEGLQLRRPGQLLHGCPGSASGLWGNQS